MKNPSRTMSTTGAFAKHVQYRDYRPAVQFFITVVIGILGALAIVGPSQ